MSPSTIQLIEFCIQICVAVLVPIIPAYVLYKTLPAHAKVAGPFKGLNIQLAGAFAGYFLVFLVVAGLISTRQAPSRYEVWNISGKVQLKNPRPDDPILHSDFSVQPPTTLLSPDGRFSLDVPVKLGQGERLEFPIIVINHRGHQPETIPLGDQQPTFGGKSYKLQSDNDGKKRIIETVIELQPLPNGGGQP
ncbi:MAG: hypothetical protein HXY26_03075 [Hydrogenophilaceae bacterium]|nr:hypothetical protein [Hydrogenophilaceae bacterium]